MSVWCTDQAGPFQTVPYAGQSWCPEGEPACQPHEYIRNGTAKMLTLLHPHSGQVRVQGTLTCPNAVLHDWLKRELTAIVAALPPVAEDVQATPEALHAAWERWQADLTNKVALPAELPPLRLLLILDNLAGHKTAAFVEWLLANGILPLYTPLGGSWLNMAESIQRILKRRALDGQHPTDTEQIIAWLEAVTTHWNQEPTPFVWGGKRQERRQRQRARRHRTGGSGAYTRRPISRRAKLTYGDRQAK